MTEPTKRQLAAWALYGANAIILGSAVEHEQVDADGALKQFTEYMHCVEGDEERDAALAALRAWVADP